MLSMNWSTYWDAARVKCEMLERVPRYRICCRGHRRTAWRVSRCGWTGAPPDWQRLCNHDYSSGTWMVCLCCAADGETVGKNGKKILKMTTPQRKVQDELKGGHLPAGWTTEWKTFHSLDDYTCMGGHQCVSWKMIRIVSSLQKRCDSYFLLAALGREDTRFFIAV